MSTVCVWNLDAAKDDEGQRYALFVKWKLLRLPRKLTTNALKHAGSCTGAAKPLGNVHNIIYV